MNNNEQKLSVEENIWFYEKNGQRIGGISEIKIMELINAGELSYGASVWKPGFSEWMKIENTALSIHLGTIAPPPLAGDHMNNNVVWVLAFAPIIGLLLQYFISGMVHSSSQYLTEKAVADGDYTITIKLINSDNRSIKIGWLPEINTYISSSNTKPAEQRQSCEFIILK